MKKAWKGAAICAAAALVVATAFSGCGNKEEVSSVVEEVSSVAPVRYDNINPLTGLNDLPTAAKNQRPVAVMINNNPNARPPWGITAADMVIEGLVEGGATRMMWLYSDISAAPKIGSLRSMRHDFVELAKSLDAVLVHWGGSPQAYTSVTTNGVDDIDGISGGGNFFRDQTRLNSGIALEHTGYTTGENIIAAVEQKGFSLKSNGVSSPFVFGKPDEKRTLTGGSCTKVSAYFSGQGYDHTFIYNETDGLYYNYIDGEPMTDDNNGQHHAVTNVIGLFMDVSRIAGDSSGRMDMDLTGGTGFYVTGGTQETITWKKGNTPSSPLKLYDKDGNELVLNAGKSWIGLLPTSGQENTTLT